MGTSWISRNGGILEKGVDLEKGGMTPLTNYDSCPFLKEHRVQECYISWKTIRKLSYNEGGDLEAQYGSMREP